jgi:hypothetical protein
MRSTIRTAALSALAVLGAASLAPTAWAQDASRGPAPAGDMRTQMKAKMQAMREAHEKQRAQDLRTILRLRPDQEPALTTFLQSHQRPDRGAGGPDGRRGPGGPPGADRATMTTTQRLDMMDKREAERAAMRQRHEQALRTFYAALSADQKQVFDALQRVQGHGHEGGWGGHRRFGGPGLGGGFGGGFGGPPRD